MSFESRKEKLHLFWSERKLLICHQLLRLSKQEHFTLSQFLFPFHYPRNLKTSAWEAFRLMKCLASLKMAGVMVKKVELDPRYFYEIDFLKGFAGDIFRSLDNNHNSAFSNRYIPIPPNELAKLFEKSSYKHITQNGTGIFLDQDSGSFRADVVAPSFFRIKLKTDFKLLQKTYQKYLNRYRNGKLSTNGNNSAFGVAFTAKVFDEFLKILSYRQGESIIFRPGYLQGGEDELTEVFEAHFPHEFSLWKQGKYEFKFYEHLLALEADGKLSIDGIEVEKPLKRYKLGTERALRAWGLDKMPLKTTLYFSRSAQSVLTTKIKASQRHKTIKYIDVVETGYENFAIYLNRDHLHPIFMSKRHKAGKLLYTLAADGYVEYEGYERVFEYIQRDKRFKLFSQTEYEHTSILDIDEENYVIPASEVHFELIQESDLG